MNRDFSWLEGWHGEFDTAELMKLGRWEAYRAHVRHPATIFTGADVARARQNVARYDWAKTALDRLLARLAAAGPVDDAWAQRYVPAVTPYSPHFTMCPHCEFAPMHGAYDWDPAEPERVRCKGCGTLYPNGDYPETLIFQSQYDPAQIITLYEGKSWPAYGYAAIHSSFSGHARIHQCRYAANTAEDLALAYALTGQPEYAHGAAAILRRFADVHPRYLVHSAYGDFADMDPKVAAVSVNSLPKDEWCPPGNVPDRVLYSGYWNVLRWGSSGGMEGTSLQKLILAYDLVAESLPDPERHHIERDLLLDAAPMLFADRSINNKTGMNRCAVGLIGLVCGDPLLVRFGLDGFVRAVRDWWLPDGGTPESTGYASMMLHGIWRLAEALKQYEDPAGIELPPGRLDHLDLYTWPRYRAVWQGMVRSLLPSLDYPLLADNRLPCHLSAMLADVLVRNYPSAAHQDLRRAIAQEERCYAGRIAQFWYGGNLDTSAAFYRQPDECDEASPPSFQDDLAPYLSIGTLRSGPHGRDATVILSAADWKSHHHRDHLNLYYWKRGRELLTDLGYLWDMQNEIPKVRRTLAHNLVMVDEQEQKSTDRQGTFHLFSTLPGLKVMEASSNVYDAATVYRRTVAVVGEGASQYVVDIFRVAGGQIHDWVLHGPDNSLVVEGLDLAGGADAIYDLTAVHSAESRRPWTATWYPDSGPAFRVHVPGGAAEQIYAGQGFGQRKARDHGTTVPYLVRRRREDASVFVAVYAEDEAVQAVSLPYLDPHSLNVIVEVSTAAGPAWIASTGPARTPIQALVGHSTLSTDGCFAFFSGRDAALIGGTHLSSGDIHLTQERAALTGPVLDPFSTAAESGCFTDGDPALLAELVGQSIWITEPTAGGGSGCAGIRYWLSSNDTEERRLSPAAATMAIHCTAGDAGMPGGKFIKSTVHDLSIKREDSPQRTQRNAEDFS